MSTTFPKCACFREGTEGMGQAYTDTVGAKLMSAISDAIQDFPLCEEARGYFLVTLAASVLMTEGVLVCGIKEQGGPHRKLDTALVERMALRLAEQVPEMIRTRMAWTEQLQGGGIN